MRKLPLEVIEFLLTTDEDKVPVGLADELDKPTFMSWREFILKNYRNRKDCPKCGKEVPINDYCCQAPKFVWPWRTNTNKAKCNSAYRKALKYHRVLPGTDMEAVAMFYKLCPENTNVCHKDTKGPWDVKNLYYKPLGKPAVNPYHLKLPFGEEDENHNRQLVQGYETIGEKNSS